MRGSLLKGVLRAPILLLFGAVPRGTQLAEKATALIGDIKIAYDAFRFIDAYFQCR